MISQYYKTRYVQNTVVKQSWILLNYKLLTRMITRPLITYIIVVDRYNARSVPEP